MEQIMRSKTIKEFDTYFTSKHFGYRDVDHYYSVATLHNKLHKIAVPLLCLSAADDPFQPLDGEFFFRFENPFENCSWIFGFVCLFFNWSGAAIPTEAAENSSHVAIVVTARGGHIGFMDGILPKTNDEYMARLFGQYFKSVFYDAEFHDLSQKMKINYLENSN